MQRKIKEQLKLFLGLWPSAADNKTDTNSRVCDNYIEIEIGRKRE